MIDVLVVTALTEENQVVLATLDALATAGEELPMHVQLFEYDAGSGVSLRIAAACANQMGAHKMSTFVAPLLKDLRPTRAALVGIAAAVETRGIRLGDVPFSSHVLSFDDVAVENGELTFRTDGYQTDPTMRAAIGALRSTPSNYTPWRNACRNVLPKVIAALNELRSRQVLLPDDLEPPHLVVEVTAGGPFLLRDADFREALSKGTRPDLPDASRIRVSGPVHPKLVSVEMESHGFMSAASDAGVPACVLKGISDVGDAGKAELERASGGFYRAYACSNAVVALLHALRRQPAALLARSARSGGHRAPDAERSDGQRVSEAVFQDLTKGTGKVRRQVQVQLPPKAEPALRLGDFVLMEHRGAGGFGEVWLARHIETHRASAVKILRRELCADPARVSAFEHGAQQMARLHHEAIVPVLHEPRRWAGRPWFPMEWMDGGDLESALWGATPTLNALDALRAVARAGRGLAHAHAHLVHRDVKPSNILLDAEGRGYLTDFDLVVESRGDPMSSTMERFHGGKVTHFWGSLLFVAPEVLGFGPDHRKKRGDRRADVYGLAMTALSVLVGIEVLADNFRRPEAWYEALAASKALETAIREALLHDPDQRPGSVEPLVRGIEEWVNIDAAVRDELVSTARAARKVERRTRAMQQLREGLKELDPTSLAVVARAGDKEAYHALVATVQQQAHQLDDETLLEVVASLSAVIERSPARVADSLRSVMRVIEAEVDAQSRAPHIRARLAGQLSVMAWHAKDTSEAPRLAVKALSCCARDYEALRLGVTSLERLGLGAQAADMVERRWAEFETIDAQLFALETLERAERLERSSALRDKIERENPERLSEHETHRASALIATATQGDTHAGRQLASLVCKCGRLLPDSKLIEVVSTLAQVCRNDVERARELLDGLSGALEAQVDSDRPTAARAELANRLSILAWSAERPTESFAWSSRAMSLDSTQFSFVARAAIALEAMDRPGEAADLLKARLTSDAEIEHLLFALRIFDACNRRDEAAMLRARLHARDSAQLARYEDAIVSNAVEAARDGGDAGVMQAVRALADHAAFVSDTLLRTTIDTAYSKSIGRLALAQAVFAALEPTARTLIISERPAAVRAHLANRVGMIAWITESYESSLEWSKLAVDLNGEELAYRYNTALALIELKRHADAADLLEGRITAGSDNADHLSLAITAFEKAGRAAAAQPLRERLNEVDPRRLKLLDLEDQDSDGSSNVAFQREVVATMTGDPAAIGRILQALREGVERLNDEQLQFSVGALWSGTRRSSEQAQEILSALDAPIRRAVASERPAAIRAHLANRLGMIAWAADNYEVSLEWSKLAVELNAESLAYRYNTALALVKLKRHAEAADLLEGRVSTTADNADHLALAITVLEQTGRADAAQPLRERLSAVDPMRLKLLELEDQDGDSPGNTAFRLEMTAARTGDPSAIGRMLQAVCEGPERFNDEQLQLAIGALWSGTRRSPERARAILTALEAPVRRAVASERPSAVRAHLANRLGMIAWIANDNEASLEWSKLAVELNAESLAYRYNAALDLVKLKRHAEAADLLEGRVTAASDDGDHLSLAITALEKAGRADAARPLRERLNEVEPMRLKLLDREDQDDDGSDDPTFQLEVAAARAGDTDAIGRMLQAVCEDAERLNDEQIQLAIGALWSGTRRSPERAQEILADLKPAIRRAVASERPAVVRAHLANRLGMIAWIAGADETALEWSKLAVELNGEELAYRYNAALALVKLKRHAEAADLVEGRITAASDNARHLSFAITTFEKAGRAEAARPLRERLSTIDPGRFKLLDLEDQDGDATFQMEVVAARAGDPSAIERILQTVCAGVERLNDEQLQRSLGALWSGTRRSPERAKEILAALEGPVRRAVASERPAAVRADLANRFGMIAWVVNDFEMSLEWSKLAVELTGADLAYRYNTALALVELNRHAEAVDLLEGWVTAASDDGDHLSLAITALEKTGRAEAARPLRERLSEVDPMRLKLLELEDQDGDSRVDTMFRLEVAAAGAGDPGAIGRVLEAIRDGVERLNDQQFQLGIGALWSGTRRWPERAREILAALEAPVRRAVASERPAAVRANVANRLGMIAWIANENEASLEWSKLAVELNAELLAYRYNTALVLIKLKRYAEAADLLEGRITAASDDADHLSLAITALEKANRADAARPLRERLNEVEPMRLKLLDLGDQGSEGSGDAAFRLEVVAARAGDPDAIERMLRTVCEGAERLGDEQLQLAIGALWSGSRRSRERAREIRAALEAPVRRAVASERPAAVRADLANRLGMIAWVGDEDDVSLEWSRLAVELNGEELAYRYNTALSLVKLKRHAEAADLLEGRITAASDDADHLSLAITALEKANRADAARPLRERLNEVEPMRLKLLDLEDQDGEAAFQLEVVAARAGDLDAIERMLRTVCEGAERLDDEKLQATLGALWSGTRRFSERAREIRAALEAPVRRAVASERPAAVRADLANRLGMIAWVADEVEASLEWSKLAVELNGEELAYRYNTALSLVKLKRHAEAADLLEGRITAASDDADHLALAITALEKTNRADAARPLRERLNEVEPMRLKLLDLPNRDGRDLNDMVKGLGAAFKALDPRVALRRLEALVEGDSELALSLMAAGMGAPGAIGRVAANVRESAERLNDEQLQLALSVLSTGTRGSPERAREVLTDLEAPVRQAVTSERPEATRADLAYHFGAIAWAADDHGASLEWSQLAVELNGAEPAYRNHTAVALMKLKRYDAAAALLEGRVTAASDDANCLALALTAFEKAGRVDAARPLRERLNEVDPMRLKLLDLIS